MKIKLNKIINEMNSVLLERDELIKLTFLALFSGESILLLGKPGIAKSLLARQIKNALKKCQHFECLLNNFSTPEEIFGPIKLSELNNDKFERKIEKYLPTANVAFLDEIWKASPAIQNTLLTIINEKIYKNGDKEIKCPLKLLIAASNELPQEGMGLEALYDRFLIRYYVDPIINENNFIKLMNNNKENISIPEKEKISFQEINQIIKDSECVNIPNSIFDFVLDYRKKIINELNQKAPYISDRRWKKIFRLLKVNAFVSERNEVNIADLTLLPNLIWENPSQKKYLQNIFDELFVDLVSRKVNISFNELKTGFEKIASEISTYNIDKTPISLEKNRYNDPTKKSVFFKFINNDQDEACWIPLIKNSNNNKYVYDERNIYVGCHYGHNSYYYLTAQKSDNYLEGPSWKYLDKIDFLNEIIDEKNGWKMYKTSLLDVQTVDIDEMNRLKNELLSLDKHASYLKEEIAKEVDKLRQINSILNNSYLETLNYANNAIIDFLSYFKIEKNHLLDKIEMIINTKIDKE
ncbi:AAA family ATPase [Mycoplasma sp. Mirounga ES2805-ORL]|uniref:AAA family ATPase n=1 Tax=Mycoplasma sp. Mirounga ES2805-ORL TaxID=754514 RepID=UPI00197B80BB|nr:AAA family ATPase [Mycoplasma sp. Mirounga ES2805-ORL]QSF13920.1 AAA family ATPase [Mycoplasma sp. Mirounga ES2805-ORL]